MSGASEDIVRAAEALPPITLAEMDGIKLMNRIDTKFLLTRSQLLEFLRRAKGRYMAARINGKAICAYDTIYYDTPGLEMYLAHHNRRLTRKKVRVRTYIDSDGLTFLEIKRKNNHGRTKKKRIECSRSEVFSPECSAFLSEKSGYSPAELAPACSTAFNRITLVNNARTERLTIDLDLRFGNPRNSVEASLGSAVVMELKQDGLQSSPAREILQEMRVHPFKISKYCIGTALTSPGLKQNRFKGKIHKIEKLINTKLI